MLRSEYQKRMAELSVKFLRAKNDGTIPENQSWAQWCINEGIYPLQDDPPRPSES